MRAIWKDASGNEHYVDELSDRLLILNYGFMARMVNSLNARIGQSWDLADFVGSDLAIGDVTEGIVDMNEELIEAVNKRNALHREIKKRGLQV
jgi:hypothetical protein